MLGVFGAVRGKCKYFSSKSTVQTIYVTITYLFDILLAFDNNIITVGLI